MTDEAAPATPAPPPQAEPMLVAEAYDLLVSRAYRARGGWVQQRLTTGSTLAMRVIADEGIMRRDVRLQSPVERQFDLDVPELVTAAMRHDKRLGIQWHVARRGRSQSGAWIAVLKPRLMGESLPPAAELAQKKAPPPQGTLL